MRQNKMETAYSLIAVRGENIEFHYEGHNSVMKDGQPTEELEQFSPGSALESRAKSEIKDIMRLHPHINRMQLKIWEN